MTDEHASEYRVRKLGDICEVLDSIRVPINSLDRAKRVGQFPYYGANGIQGYIDDYIFDGPAVLLAEDGGYFDEYSTRPIAQYVSGKYWVNNHAHILRGTNGYETKWLFYTLVHKNILKYINGGTRAKLNQADLREIEILCPPLAEQKKIAEILSSVDEVIENTESEINKLEDLKKATLNELLTKGIGHTEFKDSEIGRIPKSWATSTAEGLYEKVRVQVVYDKNTVGLKGKFEVIDQSASGSIGFIEEPTFHCSDDSPLVTFANHTCAVRLMQKPFGVIQNVFPLRSKAGVDPFFLYYSLLGAIPQTAYKGHYPELREKVFAVPSSLEQKTISATICAIDQRIGAMSRRREKVLGVKKALMQDLLTGKVRVKVN
jgi:type I restriction enzyme S subunit